MSPTEADISSAYLLTESEKLAQAVDEFPKQLKPCDEVWDKYSE